MLFIRKQEQKLLLDKHRTQLDAANEDRDYYQMVLYEEKLNNKALSVENFRYKTGKVKSLK